MQTQRLRIAIQKKGRLSKESQALLKQCGVKFNVMGERLVVHSENMPIDLLLVRDDDIPGLIMDGVVDLGFIGENELEEVRLDRKALGEPCEFVQLRRLDFGGCRLSIAIDKDEEYNGPQDLAGKRIATTYPQLLKAYMDEAGVPFSTCMLTGSVEVAPRAGLADAIADLVSTGATLEANGLKEAEVIFRSKATLIQRIGEFDADKAELINKLLTRMQGVQQAKESKYIMLHAPAGKLEQIKALLPGAEDPTVLPLSADKQKVAVHLVSTENLFWETMEQLKELGASSILVLPIEKNDGVTAMRTVVWQSLSEEQQDAILERPAIAEGANITAAVADVIAKVRTQGDAALLELTEKFDRVKPESIRVPSKEINAASERLSAEMKQALEQAYSNIAKFHKAQKPQPIKVETQPGVMCEQVTRPIQKVGLYIPGGSAPLPSTVLMLGVPAKIAGCRKVVLCSPPPIADEILYVAKLCGIDEVYNVGGGQAVAAMAYGTKSVSKVDKIFGPGNAYVTEAKRQVSNDFRGAAIDMPAGPSEVLVIADETADPDFIAADLLSQAEHGPDSQVVLVTPSPIVADQVTDAVQRQLKALSRADIAQKALASSLIIISESITQAVSISNYYGPEHLIVQTKNPRELLPLLDNAGSIFLGDWSPESAGDYASGTNHVLPTYGYTRTYSSLGLADFF